MTFPKSDVVIKPTAGLAVFYSYKAPESDLMDDGYTEHNICPVTAGEQWVTTLHMIGGVAQPALLEAARTAAGAAAATAIGKK